MRAETSSVAHTTPRLPAVVTMEIPAPVMLSIRTHSKQMRRGAESCSAAESSNWRAHPSRSSTPLRPDNGARLGISMHQRRTEREHRGPPKTPDRGDISRGYLVYS